ncbi:MAG: class III extradiol dioxygenase subunit B-like domain-containing protein [Eggerthellaceae bacterium]|jgi:AmmeMemoRadiSam system protein B
MGVIAGFAVPHPPLIIPAVGRGEEKKIQETIDAYYTVARRIRDLKPEVIILSSPHAPLFRDAFHISVDDRFSGSMKDFYAPQEKVSVPGDVELAKAIIEAAEAANIPAGPYGGRRIPLDHASFIPLWFLQQVGFSAPIVHMGFSGFPFAVHYRLGRIIDATADRLGRRAVWVASGDLSHKQKADGPYGLVPEGPEFDRQICDIFRRGALDEMADFDEDFTDKAAECGLRSFMLMAGALQGKRYQSELLSHSAVFGVGYGVASFIVEPEQTDADSASGQED